VEIHTGWHHNKRIHGDIFSELEPEKIRKIDMVIVDRVHEILCEAFAAWVPVEPLARGGLRNALAWSAGHEEEQGKSRTLHELFRGRVRSGAAVRVERSVLLTV
jgi:hypothetical protein